MRPQHVRGLLGAGATPPPSFSSLPADIQSQFGPIAQNLAQEGGGTADPDELYFAQSNFADVLNTLQQEPQIGTGPAVNAAVTFCSLAHTAAGAAQAVDGLLQEGLTPGSVQGVVQAFTGTSMGLAGTVAGGAIAIGGTLATAGVGAAIAVGIGVILNLAGSMFNTPLPVATVGSCNLNYKPTLQIPGAFVWSRDATAVNSGPSTASYSAWRRFPNPNASPLDPDAWWYMRGGFSLGAENHQWRGNEWHACISINESKRPIDQACYENGQNVFTQIECDAKAATLIAELSNTATSYTAEQVALARFQLAFFAAWKSNREYDFNGLARQSDWQVLMQTARFWNAAHEAGNGYEISAAPFAPASDDSQPSSCGSSYVAMLLGDLQQNGPAALVGYSATTGRGVLTSAGALHINTGPKRGAATVTSGIFKGLLNKSVPKSTSSLAIVGGTVAVLAAAAGGYSLWAYFAGQSQSEAWSRLGHYVWDQGAKSGSHLVEANPLKGARLLGAGEAAEEPKRSSLKVQSLLFPKDQFTVAQSRAWAKAHHFKAVKVEGQGEYHRIRQFSPARSTVLRTISFGDSGIRAVVAR
ncbi:MAG: hypothetical protein ACYDDA_04720 [Acidiferrobacteraceae bacterium]